MNSEVQSYDHPPAFFRGRCVRLLLILLLGLAPSAVTAGEFVRGDVNTDDFVDLGDVIGALGYMFNAGPVYCADAMDVNDDGMLDISDPISLVGYLFQSMSPPAQPFGLCGVDPTADNLSCDSFAPCNLGDAIPGLDAAELASFLHGRELMSKEFTPEEGLGPLFNTTSCVACHSTPVPGGSAPIYRNFYLVGVGNPPGQAPAPGVPSLAMPSYNLNSGGKRPSIPTPSQVGGQTVTSAHRNAPPFLGVGLFEFVSNATILGNADPNDSNGDGISGRWNADDQGSLGRFGYKLQANFIEAFIRGAAFNQMGITTNPIAGSAGVVSYKYQVGAGYNSPTIDNDAAPDPEISVQDFGDIVAFNRFVAPAPVDPLTTTELQGEALFDTLDCTKCHFPSLPSSVGPLAAYTDLLLHDMGPALADGISMGMPQFTSLLADFTSTATEFRTQPLWGVRLHGPFLHDGRADTLHEAVMLHGGEGSASRDAYSNLTPAEQALVIEFLEAL